MHRFFPPVSALLYILLSALPLPAGAQASSPTLPTTLEGWADRLARFGKGIPQEKVYVHMDNTCYFLGDTLWFAAYTRRTDTDVPSDISHVLYAELFDQDGYLVERQLIEMQGGHGYGNFALPDTLYAGYYELRAYTRWQLNWGVTEKEHTSYAEEWFFNKEMAKEFYCDYDKLYSRVFPVYDKPGQPGEFYHDMTARPLRRYFKSGAPEPQPVLSLFPEGGNLVAGVPCRVAFEAATEAGEALEGKLVIEEAGVGDIPTVNRGRGVFTFTPEAGRTYEAVFTASDGRTARAKLPAAEPHGVALSVQYPATSSQEPPSYVLTLTPAGEAATKPLGVTIMREGVVLHTEVHDASAAPVQILFDPSQGQAGGTPGIYQATVFDADGRIYADRLFFVTSPALAQPTLTVEGLKEQYAPYEEATLTLQRPAIPSPGIQRPAIPSPGPPPVLSLAVRDAATQDYTYDNGNILTEMLLASELKGFIPDPDYFFEADDEEHRQALDLLMLTQGWRRFDWHAMATPGAFALTQPAETQTQILRGEVLRYEEAFLQDDVRSFDNSTPTPYQMEDSLHHLSLPSANEPSPERSFRKRLQDSDMGLSIIDNYNSIGQGEVIESIVAQTYAHESHFPAGSYRMRAPIAVSRFAAKERPLAREVRIHAEFTQPGSPSVLGDVETRGGRFNIPAPRFEDRCVFFLSASDTTKWKAGKTHQWIDVDETHAPEFYVRLLWPYPHFTKPYAHYQTAYRPAPESAAAKASPFQSEKFNTQMQTLTVRARHGGLRQIDTSKPAFVADAYAAFNEACDAGLMAGRYGGRIHFINSLARLFVGDMQTDNAYLLEPRYEGHNISVGWPAQRMDKYNQLTNIDSVRVYTDYAPRTGGDPRATDDNVGRISIDLRRYPDEGQRVTYRDRRYILQGFAVADDFYHPDYRRTPPAEGAKDYRRTLYWNPKLQLDDEGKATIRFFTGSRPTTLDVEANGQAHDGTPLHVLSSSN